MLQLHVPLKYKVYGLLALAFVLGLLRWRNAAVNRALEDAQRKQQRELERALAVGREVRDEVEILDDVHLAERAAKWVRRADD